MAFGESTTITRRLILAVEGRYSDYMTKGLNRDMDHAEGRMRKFGAAATNVGALVGLGVAAVGYESVKAAVAAEGAQRRFLAQTDVTKKQYNDYTNFVKSKVVDLGQTQEQMYQGLGLVQQRLQRSHYSTKEIENLTLNSSKLAYVWHTTLPEAAGLATTFITQLRVKGGDAEAFMNRFARVSRLSGGGIDIWSRGLQRLAIAMGNLHGNWKQFMDFAERTAPQLGKAATRQFGTFANAVMKWSNPTPAELGLFATPEEKSYWKSAGYYGSTVSAIETKRFRGDINLPKYGLAGSIQRVETDPNLTGADKMALLGGPTGYGLAKRFEDTQHLRPVSQQELERQWRQAAQSDEMKLKQFGAAMRELNITIGEGMTPVVRDVLPPFKSFVNEFTKLARAHPAVVTTTAKVLGTIGAVSILVKVLSPFIALLTGSKHGGALGKIPGVGAIAGRGSTPVNPLFVAVVNGGKGIGGLPGGLPGVAGGAAAGEGAAAVGGMGMGTAGALIAAGFIAYLTSAQKGGTGHFDPRKNTVFDWNRVGLSAALGPALFPYMGVLAPLIAGDVIRKLGIQRNPSDKRDLKTRVHDEYVQHHSKENIRYEAETRWREQYAQDHGPNIGGHMEAGAAPYGWPLPRGHEHQRRRRHPVLSYRQAPPGDNLLLAVPRGHEPGRPYPGASAGYGGHFGTTSYGLHALPMAGGGDPRRSKKQAHDIYQPYIDEPRRVMSWVHGHWRPGPLIEDPLKDIPKHTKDSAHRTTSPIKSELEHLGMWTEKGPWSHQDDRTLKPLRDANKGQPAHSKKFRSLMVDMYGDVNKDTLKNWVNPFYKNNMQPIHKQLQADPPKWRKESSNMVDGWLKGLADRQKDANTGVYNFVKSAIDGAMKYSQQHNPFQWIADHIPPEVKDVMSFLGGGSKGHAGAGGGGWRMPSLGGILGMGGPPSGGLRSYGPVPRAEGAPGGALFGMPRATIRPGPADLAAVSVNGMSAGSAVNHTDIDVGAGTPYTLPGAPGTPWKFLGADGGAYPPDNAHPWGRVQTWGSPGGGHMQFLHMSRVPGLHSGSIYRTGQTVGWSGGRAGTDALNSTGDHLHVAFDRAGYNYAWKMSGGHGFTDQPAFGDYSASGSGGSGPAVSPHKRKPTWSLNHPAPLKHHRGKGKRHHRKRKPKPQWQQPKTASSPPKATLPSSIRGEATTSDEVKSLKYWLPVFQRWAFAWHADVRAMIAMAWQESRIFTDSSDTNGIANGMGAMGFGAGANNDFTIVPIDGYPSAQAPEPHKGGGYYGIPNQIYAAAWALGSRGRLPGHDTAYALDVYNGPAYEQQVMSIIGGIGFTPGTGPTGAAYTGTPMSGAQLKYRADMTANSKAQARAAGIWQADEQFIRAHPTPWKASKGVQQTWVAKRENQAYQSYVGAKLKADRAYETALQNPKTDRTWAKWRRNQAYKKAQAQYDYDKQDIPYQVGHWGQHFGDAGSTVQLHEIGDYWKRPPGSHPNPGRRHVVGGPRAPGVPFHPQEHHPAGSTYHPHAPTKQQAHKQIELLRSIASENRQMKQELKNMRADIHRLSQPGNHNPGGKKVGVPQPPSPTH